MSSRAINWERNIQVSFGGKSVVIPIFTLDGNLQSGSVVFDNGVLDSARASIVQSTIGGSTYSPFVHGEDYYTPDRECWITSTTSQKYFILRDTQNYRLFISATASPWGAYLIMFHYGENYWCYSPLCRSESIESWEAFVLTNAATDSSFGLCVKNNLAVFSSTSPITYPGTQSVNIPDMKVIGNKLMNVAEDVSNDPYNNLNDNSATGGGGGTGTASVTSDDINIPSLPSLEATDTGFIRLYRPSVAELKALASYMWSSAFDIETTFKKLFADPMDAILGLSMFGVSAPAGATQNVTVGNISTGVSMTTLSQQYFEVDCGTLNVQEIIESYLSFSPYTKVSIYLPFIGVQQLNVDDFMGGSVSLTYKFDALSGSCLALLTCSKSNPGVAPLNSVLYSFMGQCASTIPVNSNDFSNMISSAITIGASIAGIAATGGAAAPLAVPTMASAAVNALKPTISHSGSISGTGAILGVKTPYLIFERPRYCIPSNQNKYIGYPSFITEKIGDLSGYTVFEDVKIIGNSHATIGEIEEIETILKEGVYL